jgi:hypothetical protein
MFWVVFHGFCENDQVYVQLDSRRRTVRRVPEGAWTTRELPGLNEEEMAYVTTRKTERGHLRADDGKSYEPPV